MVEMTCKYRIVISITVIKPYNQGPLLFAHPLALLGSISRFLPLDTYIFIYVFILFWKVAHRVCSHHFHVCNTFLLAIAHQKALLRKFVCSKPSKPETWLRDLPPKRGDWISQGHICGCHSWPYSSHSNCNNKCKTLAPCFLEESIFSGISPMNSEDFFFQHLNV